MGNGRSEAREAPRRGPHTSTILAHEDTADQRAVTTDSREPA
jgi:hypothetical protein